MLQLCYSTTTIVYDTDVAHDNIHSLQNSLTLTLNSSADYWKIFFK